MSTPEQHLPAADRLRRRLPSGHAGLWALLLLAAALLAGGILLLDGMVGHDGPDIDLRIEAPAAEGGGG